MALTSSRLGQVIFKKKSTTEYEYVSANEVMLENKSSLVIKGYKMNDDASVASLV